MEHLPSDTAWVAFLDMMRATSTTTDRRELAKAVLYRLRQQEMITAAGVWLRVQDALVCLVQDGFTQPPSLVQIHRTIEQGSPAFLNIGAGQLEIWPLMAYDTAFGALVVHGTATNASYERALREALAIQLGLALYNAKSADTADFNQPPSSETEWEQFLSHASHEIKNPLASIKGYADLLGRRAAKDEAAAPYHKGLGIISQQVGKTTFLLEQLSDLSRIGTGRLYIDPHPTDLAAIVQRVVDTERATTEMHDIATQGIDAPFRIGCDSVRIEQTINAMVGNAIKFSPDGGTIRVDLQRVEREAVVVVRDHGIGVPEGEEERVFERFFRGSNAAGFYRGLGVGLFIGRAVAERHGGRMWLQRAPDQGTASYLALPLQ